jgi:hypothetical protein
VADLTLDQARGSRRQLPVAVNFATVVLAGVASISLILLAPMLIVTLVGDRSSGQATTAEVLLASWQLAATAAIVALSVAVRRGTRPAWLALIALVVLDAAIGPIWLYVERADDAPTAAPLLRFALAAVVVMMLVGPRSSRAYFRPST